MQVLHDLAIHHGDPLPRRFGGRESSNLAAGNYEIEFRNQPGWVVLPLGGPVTLSSGAALAITNDYFPTVGEGVDVGQLTLTIALPAAAK